ncbi:MAG: carbohydrate ABC transporter permease [Actinobacteria bacterium]|nr:carbohydrate ABC transporter permease [Actinomycetota bacterium]
MSTTSSAQGRRTARRFTLGGLLKQALLVAMCVIAIYPLYYMVITAFKSREEYLNSQYLPPLRPTLDNVLEALSRGDLITWTINSVLVTVFSVLIAIAVSVLAAYALARMSFYGRDAFLNGTVALMVVPPVVLVVPLFLLMVQAGLINSLPSVIIVYTGLTIPISVYLLTNFFRALPYEIEEAARIDGCTTFGILWRIVLPLSAPALLTCVVVNALFVWNELLVALVFLQSNESRTLVAGLTLFKGQFSVNEPLVMSGALIATVPMLLLYLFGQRFFIRGLVAGAGK